MFTVCFREENILGLALWYEEENLQWQRLNYTPMQQNTPSCFALLCSPLPYHAMPCRVVPFLYLYPIVFYSYVCTHHYKEYFCSTILSSFTYLLAFACLQIAFKCLNKLRKMIHQGNTPLKYIFHKFYVSIES